MLFDRYLQADLVVLASPIYHATMNARMKLFVERTLPMMDPLGETPEGGGHPHRFEKMPQVVALSVCRLLGPVHVPGPVPDLAHDAWVGISSPKSTAILPNF